MRVYSSICFLTEYNKWILLFQFVPMLDQFIGVRLILPRGMYLSFESFIKILQLVFIYLTASKFRGLHSKYQILMTAKNINNSEVAPFTCHAIEITSNETVDAIISFLCHVLL